MEITEITENTENETSFELQLNSVTDKLVNVTLCETFDDASQDWEKVLDTIKERKAKRLGCDVDTLKSECQKRHGMDDSCFHASLEKLKINNFIKQIERKGKTTFSLLSVNVPAFETSCSEIRQNVDPVEGNTLLADFIVIDFKRYATECIGKLDQKIEMYQSTSEIKDVVIKILRKKLKYAQENLKTALEQNSLLTKTLKNSQTTRDIVHISDPPEKITLNKLIEDIPIDNSILNDTLTTRNDPLKDLSEKDQLKEIRSRNHNRFLSTKKTTQKNEITQNMTSHESLKDAKNVQQSQQKKNVNSRNQVFVCGDSLLNNIVGNGISSKKVKSIVRNFPGADSEDMIDYLKPILVKKKPQYLILHVGTNDVTSGCNTAENLENIQKMITDLSPDTELIISKLIIRDDKPGMSDKVASVNRILENFAEKYNLFLINNDNISRKMLSKKKIHLNGSGISQFAQNLKNFINRNC